MKNLALTEKDELFETKTLVIMSLLAAISIILTRFFSFMIGETIRISFGYIPIMISGIFFGPIGGALTGVVSDLVGIAIRAEGGFFPGFTLSYALVGIIPGIIFKINKNSKLLLKILFSVISVEIIVSLLLNTYWLNLMYGAGFWATLPSRVIARLIIGPIEIFIIYHLFSHQSFYDLFKSITNN